MLLRLLIYSWIKLVWVLTKPFNDWLIDCIDLKTNSVQSCKSLIYNLTNMTTSIKILKQVYRQNMNIKSNALSERKYSIYKFTNHFEGTGMNVVSRGRGALRYRVVSHPRYVFRGRKGLFLRPPHVRDFVIEGTVLDPEKVRYKVIGGEMKGMESSMKLVALGATQRKG